MTHVPTVSVVIPSRDHGRFLRPAVRSIVGQAFADWEIIVVDDGSTDDTPAILRALADGDPRIRHVRLEGRGPSGARNAGLRLAAGKYVQFLDADDALGPGKLGAHVAELAAEPTLDIVYGPATYFRSAGDAPWTEPASWCRTSAFPAVSGRGLLIQKALLGGNIMVIEAPLVRRRVLDAVGGFDESLPRMEDWEFWLRCALAGIAFRYADALGPEEVPYVRLHGANSSRDRMAMLRTDLEIRERLQRQLPRDLRRQNARRVADIRGRLGLAEGMDRDLWAGMRACINASRSGGHIRWLILGLLLPATRVPPTSWIARRVAERRALSR